MEFDIVIPVGPNDYNSFHKCLEYAKKNVIGYRRIYILTGNTELRAEGCHFIYDHEFPFSKNDIDPYTTWKDRIGWYFQQLLKLYCWTLRPDMLEGYLVIDSDTCFLKPTKFFDGDMPLYNIGTENNDLYFKHMTRMDSVLYKVRPESGIVHHMMFEKRFVNDMFNMVQEHNGGKPFWKVFIEKIDPWDFSGASEYEIYFSFMFIRHPDRLLIRPLNWKNTGHFEEDLNYDYISCHWWMR